MHFHYLINCYKMCACFKLNPFLKDIQCTSYSNYQAQYRPAHMNRFIGLKNHDVAVVI